MAGLTRAAKAARERLPDRISIGVLVKTFPKELLDEVIDAADAREVRYRLLPARLVLLLTLASWLFMRCGYGLVLSKLADAEALTGRGWGDWRPATRGGLSQARARLGPYVVYLLFDRVKGVKGSRSTPGVFWRGRRVATMDGFTLDVLDTEDNEAFFGRGGNGSGTPNPYPQLRAVVLAEGGTRSLLAGTFGSYHAGEQTLTEDLLSALDAGMILLADRNFPSYKLWRAAAATGAQLCWRMPASFTLPVLEVLPDGSYLSRLRPPRKKDGPPITVRIIEYSVRVEGEDGQVTSELFCLATTLLDPEAAPMRELAELYHHRWQAETGIGDLKTFERGGPEVVLRSKTPDGVAGEFWAFLCVYQAVRDLISYAADDDLDPSRISFKRAIEAARDSVTRAALSPRGS